jgi:hypothetical protein
VTSLKKIKGVGARIKNDLTKKTLLPKGVGRYEEKTAAVQDGSGLPYFTLSVNPIFFFNPKVTDTKKNSKKKVKLRYIRNTEKTFSDTR